jgi:glycosyltransferase involved in cell wall biosynthesis
MVEQTLPPLAWVIVDDDSTDDTAVFAHSAASKLSWITVVQSPGARTCSGLLRDGRRAGRDVVAFNAGIAALPERPDIVMKLDADVSFEPDFFDRLVGEFESDPTLGIAGGACYELDRGRWHLHAVTGAHVRGSTRAYRWACFQDVEPLVERLGWDGIDLIKARMQGWTTRTIATLPFRHHRPVGRRDGVVRVWTSQGETAWFMGYRPSYLLFRTLRHALRQPLALAMISGYASAALGRQARYPDTDVRTFLRREQSLLELPRRIGETFGLTSSAPHRLDGPQAHRRTGVDQP